jgi:precorrin-6A/cobalt-precorrin-6A reductase
VILLLAGTHEGSRIAAALRARDLPVLASTVRPHAAATFTAQGVPARAGALDTEGFAALVHARGVRVIVDASHPFAVGVRAAAPAASRRTGVPYVRYERPRPTYPPSPRLLWAADHRAAAAEAARLGGTVFLAVGIHSLPAYAPYRGQAGLRLVARLLPTAEDVGEARRLGFDQRDLVALAGPFRADLERALWRHFGVTTLVAKDSGPVAGGDDKVPVALDAGLTVILVRRPPPPEAPCFEDVDALAGYVRWLWTWTASPS